jgi:hypothetical protein
MAFFKDEAVRETVQPAGGAVFNLLGPVDGRQDFASAKRKDGTPVQTGDRCPVGLVQKVAGVTERVVAIATLTLGGANILTLNTVAYPSGKMYFSTAGGAFPTFDVNSTGEAFITNAIPLTPGFDDDGNLEDPFNFRKTLTPADIATFLAEIGLSDNEAIVALGRSGAGFNGIGGLFAQNDASTGTDDNVDKFTNPNSGQGKVDRVPIKVSPTLRGNTIGAGGVLSIASVIPWFDASDPTAEYFINAWDEADAQTRLQSYWMGHATTPQPFLVHESAEPALLEFDLIGTDVRIKNTTGGSRTYSLVVERIG